MITFFIGLVILAVGALLYGRLCEKIMKPTDSKTPAVEMRDGVDYVPMKKMEKQLYRAAYITAGALSLAYAAAVVWYGNRQKGQIKKLG